MTGQKLTPQQREEIVAAGQALVSQNKKDADFVLADFREMAIASGIPGETADKLILPKMPGAASSGSEGDRPLLRWNPATQQYEGLPDAGN